MDRANDLLHSAYEEYAGRLHRYCLFRTNSRQDAEDITAETFARYLERGGELSGEAVLPWLFRVAGNLCVDCRRKAARITLLEHPLSEDNGHAPPWVDAELWQALSSLKPRQQQVIYLRVIEDMTFKQIAEFLGKREGAVKAHFYRGTALLRSALKEGDVDGFALRSLGRGEI